MVNEFGDVAVPSDVVTVIVPVVELEGTIAVICVAECTVNEVAAIPLNDTAVAPEKLEPVIVIDEPADALEGEKDDIVGGITTVKLVELVTLPPGVVIAMVPVVAPVGTVAVMLVALFTVKVVAAVPLKLTPDAHKKLDPVIVTVDPIDPLVGEKDVIVGAEGGEYTKDNPMLALVLGVLIKYSVLDNAIKSSEVIFKIFPSVNPLVKLLHPTVVHELPSYFNAL